MKKWKTWKRDLVLFLVILSTLYVIPTFVKENDLPSWYPFKKRLSFGLDLKGGLELRFTVDYKKAISDAMIRTKEQAVDAVVGALAQRDGKDKDSLDAAEKTSYMKRFTAERIDFDTIAFTFEDEKDAEVLTDELVNDLRSDLIRLPPQGNKVLIKLNEKRVSAIRDEVVNQTLEVIRKRVQAFGLVEPDVRKNGDTDIDVQLPGISKEQIDLVRERIGQTARLTFRIVDKTQEGIAFFQNQAESLKAFQEKFPEKGKLLRMDRDRTTSQWYVAAQSSISPGPQDAIAKNALMSFIKTIKIPDDHMVGYELEEVRDGNIIKERFWRTHYLFSRADVTGDHLTRAMVLFDTTGEPYVSVEFNAEGAKLFEETTEKNVGEFMAIMLDDEVNSAPQIKEKIGGGRAKITLGGARHPSLVLREAQALVTVLTHGAYKAPVHKVHDTEVGPSLGRDTIEAGIISLIVAVALVFIFMTMYYHKSGLIADIGLILNVLFTVAILIGFNAALTMPGMAGIVLTVGMAVDANVLINERIREEMRLGKGPRGAVEAGYARAFTAIFDSNLTTAIAGVVLLNFASGPVYGFAVTLLIGIVVTFLTQVFITRMVFNWWVETYKPDRLSVGI